MTSLQVHRAGVLLAGAGALWVAFLLMPSAGTSDVALFMKWTMNIFNHGIQEGYRLNHTSHPPLYAVLLSTVGFASAHLGITPFVTYKLSLLVAWLLAGIAMASFSRSAWITLGFLIALLPSSLGLGFFDVYLAPLLVWAVKALRDRRTVAFALWFSAFCLIKSQALILAPFFAVFAASLWWRGAERKARDLAGLLIPPIAILVLLGALFGPQIAMSAKRAGLDGYYSGQALNVPWLVTWAFRAFAPQEFGGLRDHLVDFIYDPRQVHPIWLISRMTFFAVYGFVLARFVYICFVRDTTLTELLKFSLVGYLAYFLLNTGVHENHLVYGMMIGFLLVAVDREYTFEALFLALAANANVVLFYGITGEPPMLSRVALGLDLTVILAFINVLFGGWYVNVTCLRHPLRARRESVTVVDSR